MSAAIFELTVLGQALIQHDLRANAWPDFAVLTARFAQADLCFTDLETAIRSPLAEAPTREGAFLHAADPAVLDCLQALSISLVATANNHVGDLGRGGIIGTLREIDARGIAHAGAGSGVAVASAPVYRRTGNGTVALVAAASGAIREGAAATAGHAGVNELRQGADGAFDAGDLGRMLEAIAAAAEHAEIVLACHHNHIFDDKPPPGPSRAREEGSGKGRGGRRTPAWQRQFAHRCINAGASVYVGHGAPRLHGIEIYRGRPVFYDLGNFIFQTATEDGFYDDEVWESVIAECCFAGGRFRDMRLTPVQLNDRGIGGVADLKTRGRPSIARGAAAASILARLAELSQAYGTVLECVGDTAVIRAC